MQDPAPRSRSAGAPALAPLCTDCNRGILPSVAPPPQVVLALVGFMTFWLSPECGERLGVAVTIPLALAVYDLLVYRWVWRRCFRVLGFS